MPKVSIIIPIYNVKDYVQKTIESAINQTEKDIEIILVDDGSTDGSEKLCDQYANIDTRIMVIHKKNGGLSSARNAGTVAATSEYIMFLDGDDYLKENAVERVLKVMKKYPSDFVQFMYQEVNVKNTQSTPSQFKEIYQATTSRELFDNLYKLGGVAASGATKLMKRTLALQIPFENIRHEDEMWCTRAFQNNLTVTYIPDELYYYVMREESIIHSSFNRKKLDKFIVNETRIRVLKRLGYNDLICSEYEKLFGNILTLHREAKMARDKIALENIKEKFMENRSNIASMAKLKGKFKIIFRLMCFNYSTINLYTLYRKIKYNKNMLQKGITDAN